MDGQDWKPIVMNKKKIIKKNVKQNENLQRINKIENETENFNHKKLDISFKKAFQQARLKEKLSQKDLASRLNVKPSVINSYENGTCIPNNNFISSLERILKCKLPKVK